MATKPQLDRPSIHLGGGPLESSRALGMGRAEWIAVAAVALGVVFRVANFATRRSLWIDETFLALNIASRSYVSLFPPLDHDQSAPIVFLWLEKLATNIGGANELALRFVPLVAGIAIVVLVYPIISRFLRPAAGVMATGLMAAAPVLINYAVEVKQYSMEALVTLALFGAAVAWLERPASAWRVRTLLLLGALSVWLSGSAIFVLAGIGVVIVGCAARGQIGAPSLLRRAVWVWGISFAVAYSLVYHHASTNSYMQRFWAPAFLSPRNPDLLHNAGVSLQSVLWGTLVGREPIATSAPLPVFIAAVLTATLCLLLIVGGKEIRRTRGVAGLILVVGPLLAALGASVCGLYPISLRTLLFAAPLICLTASAGVLRAAELVLGSKRMSLQYVVLAFFLFFPIFWSTHDMLSHNPREHLRPLVATYRARSAVREPIYVFAGSIPAWTFYTTDWNHPDTARLAVLNDAARPGGFAFNNAPPRRGPIAAEEGQSYQSSVGQELLGVPTGLERNSSGLVVWKVDAGWAEYEAARIRAAAAPGVWVLMSHFFGPEGALLAELERLGGQQTYVRTGNSSFLARYQFGGH